MQIQLVNVVSGVSLQLSNPYNISVTNGIILAHLSILTLLHHREGEEVNVLSGIGALPKFGQLLQVHGKGWEKDSHPGGHEQCVDDTAAIT